jgi:hypothetical protein
MSNDDNVFEKWQPDPREITAVKTSVENVEPVRRWLSEIYGAPANESVAYLKGNQVVIDWHIKYRESFSVKAGDYLVLDANNEIRIYDESTFRKKYSRITSAVTLESEDGNCKACGQDVMAYNGQIWHVYTGRACPALMRNVPVTDVFTSSRRSS